MQDLRALVLTHPPPLDPAWLAHEEAVGLRNPKPALSVTERQPLYAAESRARNAAMMAAGARDHDLAQGVRVTRLTVASAVDGYAIPVLRYDALAGDEGEAAGDQEGGEVQSRQRQEDGERTEASSPGDMEDGQTGSQNAQQGDDVVLVYIHGGGLQVGEADSEELTCRRLVKHFPFPLTASTQSSNNKNTRSCTRVRLYSIGYRLMPQVPAETCVADSESAFAWVRSTHPSARVVLVGSSSGGELAALVSQSQPPGCVAGVLLRCPVTADAPDHVPARLRAWHTSAGAAFATALLGPFRRERPRDGLARMPLECPVDELRARRLPRTWVQVCTNDVLFSDGLCYAQALRDAGVEVRMDVVSGWPHTFWLKAPHLERALQADEEMLRGLRWVLEGDVGMA
ncbi:uncharacterized protein JN550_001485 [Neoarthrinium moseri]|uniref:uncharacterized protein n=1 Tax=Neoarthrinium moseri TaxID=1658444 RepID=UPI001FDE8A4A|nr:uncharacterized protein JN550_001485 [Neoarthrinium moseri]KAI1875989.1 hypothetical protein JN550_001485 [Neoarthrinium moseri]